MNGLVLTQPGLELVCEGEVLSYVKAKASCVRGAVVVDVKEFSDLVKIVYRGQSIGKVLQVYAHESSFEAALESLDLGDLLKDKSYACRAKSELGSSQDAMGALGARVKVLTGAKVDLKNPDVIIYAYVVEGHAFIGVDISGNDLSKREYRVFGVDQLKATTAFGALRFAGYDKKKKLVDPFCKVGLIPIEAALYATARSIHFFTKEKLAVNKESSAVFSEVDALYDEPDTYILAADELTRHVTFTKKNAKIAGVNKQIMFSRMDLDWLETRCDEFGIDMIVTRPPEPGKSLKEERCVKLYEELFYQADYIVKKKGNVTVVVRDPSAILRVAQEKGWVEDSRLVVEQGLETFFFVRLVRA